MKMGLSASASALLLALASSTFLSTSASAACVGTCGNHAGVTDGVVTAAPFADGSYQYVATTTNGPQGAASLNLGSETSGSIYTTPVSLIAGDKLAFYFNFVTTDGAGFADYAFVQLQGGTNTTLFTARTTPSGNTVPGFGMPVIAPGVVVDPATVLINAGGPAWSVLEGSGGCWDTGCGYTDWVKMEYTVPVGGDYLLAFAVTNWGDSNYQTGLAFAGLTINDIPVDPGQTPIPGAAALMGTVLAGGAGFGAWRRRRQKTAA
jgi:hypothetical protein